MYFNDIFSGFPDRNSSCIVINTRRFIFLYNDWRSKTWFRIVDMVLYSVRTNVKHSPNNLLATPKNGASQLSWKVCVFLLVLKSLHFPTCAKTQKWRKSLTCAKIACRQQMFFLSDFCQFWYTLTKIVICYLFNFSQIWTPWQKKILRACRTGVCSCLHLRSSSDMFVCNLLCSNLHGHYTKTSSGYRTSLSRTWRTLFHWSGQHLHLFLSLTSKYETVFLHINRICLSQRLLNLSVSCYLVACLLWGSSITELFLSFLSFHFVNSDRRQLSNLVNNSLLIVCIL